MAISEGPEIHAGSDELRKCAPFNDTIDQGAQWAHRPFFGSMPGSWAKAVSRTTRAAALTTC